MGTGIDDPTTGLTHIGAREYDATTGRFISLDPLIDLTDPLQMNGYTYANGNPVTYSDPSGLKPIITESGNDSQYLRDEDAWWTGGPGDWTFNNRDVKTVQGETSRTTVTTVTSIGSKFKKTVTVRHEKRSCSQKEGICGAWGPGKAAKVSSEEAHLMLDTLGMAPGLGTPADLTNGIVYAVEGNWTEAAWSVVGVVPFVGEAAAAKRKGPKIGEWITGGTKCGTGGKHSFVSGTEVLLADGSSKAIEDVEVGDEVVATDPEGGQTAAKVVTATIASSEDKVYVDITIVSDGDERTITATEHHPFWSESEHAWLNAGDLKPGTTLRAEDGTTVDVRTTRTYEDQRNTYNLTVSGLHTYYVLAGATPALVHNSNGCIHASVAYQDWATKGAHIHIGKNEVRIFPNGQGGIGAEGIRLRSGTASPKEVQKVLGEIHSNPSLRADIIDKAKSARASMNAGEFGMQSNRAVEIHFLIKALEKMG